MDINLEQFNKIINAMGFNAHESYDASLSGQRFRKSEKDSAETIFKLTAFPTGAKSSITTSDLNSIFGSKINLAALIKFNLQLQKPDFEITPDKPTSTVLEKSLMVFVEIAINQLMFDLGNNDNFVFADSNNLTGESTQPINGRLEQADLFQLGRLFSPEPRNIVTAPERPEEPPLTRINGAVIKQLLYVLEGD